MRTIPKKIRDECIRLRTADKLSTPTIAKRVGLSNFSVYKILKKYPWNPLEPAMRGGSRATWSREEIASLRRLWPRGTAEEIDAALPNRKFENASKKASALGIRRYYPGTRLNKRYVHPVCSALREIREKRKLTRPQVSKKSGFHVNQILAWELGKAMPDIAYVTVWAEALGQKLVVIGDAAAEPLIAVDRSMLTAGRARARHVPVNTDLVAPTAGPC